MSDIIILTQTSFSNIFPRQNNKHCRFTHVRAFSFREASSLKYKKRDAYILKLSGPPPYFLIFDVNR